MNVDYHGVPLDLVAENPSTGKRLFISVYDHGPQFGYLLRLLNVRDHNNNIPNMRSGCKYVYATSKRLNGEAKNISAEYGE